MNHIMYRCPIAYWPISCSFIVTYIPDPGQYNIKMKIGILGTRGIPNQYGGFEQLAEYLSVGLLKKSFEVCVYNTHNHLYQGKEWNGVNIIHCYNPEDKLKTAGQFIYDLNCILDARKRDFDVLLILGYTSISIWGRLFPKKAAIIINMDGLEWKRNKYAGKIRRFLFYAEKLAVKFCNYFVADSQAIQKYLQSKYEVPSTFIAYGADIPNGAEESDIIEKGLSKYKYFLIIARMEPENNIEMMLDGFSSSTSQNKMVVIGNPTNQFGTYLQNKFQTDSRVIFLGAIYDKAKLHSLKAFSAFYFHGHSAGGTNPSLLEAMASGALIAANNNEFNVSLLQKDAYYFLDAEEVKSLVETVSHGQKEETMIANNIRKIREEFTWTKIIDEYTDLIFECYNDKNA
jgi:glycosyltransferase involved in cell wall biosynthesis